MIADDGQILRPMLGRRFAARAGRTGRTIWTGYFDEGVFGNFGWGRPDGPDPLGAAGIVAWSPTLNKVWELDADEGLIADCYALNVAPDAVWACTYTDFPVIRIADEHEQVQSTREVSGPTGIIARNHRIETPAHLP